MNAFIAVLVSRLPAYIRDDYPKFVKALTAYYEYLLEGDGPAAAILQHGASIDVDSGQATDRLFADIGLADCPVDVRREMMTAIRDFNASRGSVASYINFFRIWKRHAVKVYGNSEALFIPSAASVERYARAIVSVDADALVPVSAVMTQTYAGARRDVVAAHRIASIGSRDIYEVITGRGQEGQFYRQPLVISDDVSEATATFIDTILVRFTSGHDFALGDVVTAVTDSVVTTGVVVKLSAPGIRSVAILSPGTGYSRGDVVSATGTGRGFSAQVSAVDVNGGVVAIEILNAGRNYDVTPEVTIKAVNGGAVLAPVGSFGNIAMVEWRTLPYGTAISTTVKSARGVVVGVEYEAALFTDVVVKTGVNGVVGEGSRLTDSLAWQFSAYTVETAAPIDTWYDAVKSDLHPLGRYMHVVKAMTTTEWNAGGLLDTTVNSLITTHVSPAFSTGEGMATYISNDTNMAANFENGDAASLEIEVTPNFSASFDDGAEQTASLDLT